jgi:formylglycine-generating enzyme required for sulfatase activity
MKTTKLVTVAGIAFAAVMGSLPIQAEQTNQGALNLRVVQRLNVGQVNLTYDLVNSNNAAMVVVVQVSTNGGATYDLPASSFTGDIGPVNIGSNKTVVWNMLADWPNQFSTNIWFRLIATDTSGFPTNMAFIPAGAFQMGDNYAEGGTEERPVHQVYVSAFLMDKFEVTKLLWDDVKSWALTNGYQFDNAGAGVATNHPVQTVSWYDAVKWCNARSELDGLTPVYYTDANRTIFHRIGKIDLSSACVRWDANGYRLPTEAEWEKAARGGLAGHHFPWNSLGLNYTNHVDGSKANYLNSGDPFEGAATKTTPVGYYNGQQTPAGIDMANGYGLYDMAGNVWEWCWDWYDASWYSNGSTTQSDTRGPTGPLSNRVLRGGSWPDFADYARCADRGSSTPTYAGSYVGFRCVRGL